MINVDGNIKKLNIKKSNKEKSVMLKYLYSYLRFLYDSKQISIEELNDYINQVNDTYHYSKHYINSEYPQVTGMLETTSKLNKLYLNILNYANNYPLFTPKMPEIDIIKLMRQAKEFLKYIDIEAYNLFNNIVKEDLFYESENANYGGICFNIGDGKSSIILRYDTHNIYKIFALVHEMGHAYHNYLNKANPSLNQTYLGKECLSRTFEQLFFLYLQENHLFNKDTIDSYERIFHIHQLKIANSSYIVNKLFLEKKIPENFYLNRIKANITDEEYQNLSILKTADKNFQSFLSYDYNFYSYALMFSLVMREKFIKDEIEARKFMKEFPYYARTLSPNELLNLISKTEYLNATNKNTSRILSKTKFK